MKEIADLSQPNVAPLTKERRVQISANITSAELEDALYTGRPRMRMREQLENMEYSRGCEAANRVYQNIMLSVKDDFERAQKAANKIYEDGMKLARDAYASTLEPDKVKYFAIIARRKKVIAAIKARREKDFQTYADKIAMEASADREDDE